MNQRQKEQTFFNAILNNPKDDAQRLVYADWLDEQAGGHSPRAEFIRAQVTAAAGRDLTGPLSEEQRTTLERRADQLLGEHRQEWTQHLEKLGARDIAFHRGFPDQVTMLQSSFLENADHLFATAPVTSLRIKGRMQPEDVQALAKSPSLTRLTSLDLIGNAIDAGGMQALVDSPHLANLTSLHLIGNVISTGGVRALAESPHLANLTSLHLIGNNLVPDGASPNLANLTSFGLEHNYIDDDGARALAASPYLAKLESLDLGINSIGDDGARALAESPHLTNLKSLGLGINKIGATGARALAASPHLKSLTSLDLRHNDIGGAVLSEIERTMQSRSAGQGQGSGHGA